MISPIIRMTLASSFAVSGGLVAMGIIESLPIDTPLTETTCFNGYIECGNELRQHEYPLIPYILSGILLITILYIILHYNKVFNKIEVDR